jgi:hypothetical protein
MTSENNIADKLSKIAKLRADGVLSEQDFKALKARLLSQVSETHTDARENRSAPIATAGSRRDQDHDVRRDQEASMGTKQHLALWVLGGCALLIFAFFVFGNLNSYDCRSKEVQQTLLSILREHFYEVIAKSNSYALRSLAAMPSLLSMSETTSKLGALRDNSAKTQNELANLAALKENA